MLGGSDVIFFFSSVLLPWSNKFRSLLNCHCKTLYHNALVVYYLYICIYCLWGKKLASTRLSGHHFVAPQSIFIYNSFFPSSPRYSPMQFRVQKLNSFFIGRLMVCIHDRLVVPSHIAHTHTYNIYIT